MQHTNGTPAASKCRICGGSVQEFLDLGQQPVSNAFRKPEEGGCESFYRLAIGACTSCTMVQQIEDVPRDLMFHADYLYRSSTSSLMSKHFERTARRYLETELAGRGAGGAFVVEIGCNDGIMLQTISDAGVRHLGVDPSEKAAQQAMAKGIRVRVDFFEETSAAWISATDGPANLIYSANTFSHISDIGSIWRGVDLLLAPDGIFAFEDRYLGDIVEHTYFDQIYDEHVYLFAVRSVQAMAAWYGFELVDVERIPVHGGSIRYTVARPGSRQPTPAVQEMLDRERVTGLADPATFEGFAANIDRVRNELVALLTEIRDSGQRVVGYGATSKSATVTNFCGIGPELVPFVCDSTPEKQGRLSPGSRIPVRPSAEFTEPYPDYALLFAWNHAEEIIVKESQFRERGGKWILYVPDVHIV